MNNIDDISGDVVGEAIRIHRELGPGLLESVYEIVLAESLARKGYRVARQVPIDIFYDGLQIPGAFRVDLLIEGRLVNDYRPD